MDSAVLWWAQQAARARCYFCPSVLSLVAGGGIGRRGKMAAAEKKKTDGDGEAAVDLANIKGHAIEAIKKIQPYLDKARPYAEKIRPLVKQALPYFALAWVELKKLHLMLQPYYSQEAADTLFAVILLFFGGQFAMTIACVQAFRMSGWSRMKESWTQLRESYAQAVTTLEKDNEARKLFDKDGDGALSLHEIAVVFKEMIYAESPEQKEVALKRTFLILKCVDPNKILDALVGLWVGIVTVLSTLRSQMAYCVGIGASIGKVICDTMKNYTQERLYAALPEHKKWVDFALRASCGLLGILISLFLVRVVSAFNSALQGSAVLTAVLMKRLRESGIKDKSDREKEEMVKWVLATVGFLWQLKSGFDLPFLLKIPLLPVYMVESFLGVLAVY